MSQYKQAGAQIFRVLALLLMLPGLVLILSHQYWWLGIILIFIGIYLASIYRRLIGSPLQIFPKDKAAFKKKVLRDARESAKSEAVFILAALIFIALGLYLISFSWGKIPGIISLIIGAICAILGWPFFLF
jgi:hypothetical protein